MMIKKIIEEAKESPVYVLTANPKGGEILLRTLSISDEDECGSININFITPVGLAEKIIEKQFIEKNIVTLGEMDGYFAIIRILQEHDSSKSEFKDIINCIGFPKSLHSFFNIMRLSGITPDNLKSLSAENKDCSKKWDELYLLYNKYFGWLDDKYDEASILSMAISGLNAEECRFLKESKLYWMQDIPSYRLYAQFNEKLGEKIGGTKQIASGISDALAMTNAAGDQTPRVSDHTDLQKLKENFPEMASSEKDGFDGTVRLFSTAGRKKEVHEVVRSIAYESEGSMGENCLILPNYNENVQYIADMLSSAGIPAIFTGGLPVSVTGIGIAMKFFIRFLHDDRNPIPFIKLLEQAPLDLKGLLKLKEDEVPHKRIWISLLRDVVLSGGPIEWLNLLEKQEKQSEADKKKAAGRALKTASSGDAEDEIFFPDGIDAEEHSSIVNKARQQLVIILKEFVSDFYEPFLGKDGKDGKDGKVVKSGKGEKDVKDAGKALAGDAVLPFKDILSALREFPGKWLCVRSEDDGEAIKKIRDHFDEMIESSGIFSLPFRYGLQVLEERISGLMINAKYPDGKSLVVAPYSLAGTVAAKHKYIFGMNENTVPHKFHAVPFLPEKERTMLNESFSAGIPGRDECLKKERDIFLDGIHSTGNKLTLSYTDIDPDESRRLMPGNFILTAYESITGRPGIIENIRKWSNTGLPEEDKQVNRADFERMLIAKDTTDRIAEKLLPQYLNLVPGFEAYTQRMDFKHLTDWDGVITDKALLKKCGLFVKSDDKYIPTLSNSKIRSFITCPFSYFLKYILHISPAPEVEVDRSMWPDNPKRGEIYHDIYFHFLCRMRERSALPLKYSEKDLKALISTGMEQTDAYAVICEPPNDFMRKAFEAELEHNLQTWYTMEVNDQKIWKPVYFELPFGKPYKETHDPDIDGILSAILKLKDGNMLLSGSIDRIDIDGNKNIRITDYKTGRNGPGAEKMLEEGTETQLIFYTLAFKKIVKLLEGISGCNDIFVRYYYSTERGNFEKVEIENAGRYTAGLERFIALMQAQARKGLFFSNAGNAECVNKYTGGCEYYRVCGKLSKYIYKSKYSCLRDTVLKDIVKTRSIAWGSSDE